MSQALATVKVADEVWISAALLQREHPAANDFTIEEILQRAERENIHGSLRPGVYVHIVQHCVANRPPNPGRYRMLFETSEGRRRLFRSGDVYHPGREGAKVTPDTADLPPQYTPLLEWHRSWSEEEARKKIESDPLIQAIGSGKRFWGGESIDEHIRQLREGWE